MGRQGGSLEIGAGIMEVRCEQSLEACGKPSRGEGQVCKGGSRCCGGLKVECAPKEEHQRRSMWQECEQAGVTLRSDYGEAFQPLSAVLLSLEVG